MYTRKQVPAMIARRIPMLIFAAIVIAAGTAAAAQSPIEQLDTYREQGIEQVDSVRGKGLWYAPVNERSCTHCHGDNPADTGKHAKTGKWIAAMAPSVNPERYRSARKIEKWFLRNCKWTFGRECNTQEKADILTWLAGQ
jgi:hypothetical protein